MLVQCHNPWRTYCAYNATIQLSALLRTRAFYRFFFSINDFEHAVLYLIIAYFCKLKMYFTDEIYTNCSKSRIDFADEVKAGITIIFGCYSYYRDPRSVRLQQTCITIAFCCYMRLSIKFVIQMVTQIRSTQYTRNTQAICTHHAGNMYPLQVSSY